MTERTSEQTLYFGDGEHKLSLTIPLLEELQENLDLGPLQLLRRTLDGTWRVQDVREVIRLGLIGGGMKPLEALKLVERYASEAYIDDAVPVAFSVIAAAISGVDEKGLRFGREPSPA